MNGAHVLRDVRIFHCFVRFAIFAEAKPRLGRTVSRQGRSAALHSACAVLARRALPGEIRFRPFAGSVPLWREIPNPNDMKNLLTFASMTVTALALTSCGGASRSRNPRGSSTVSTTSRSSVTKSPASSSFRWRRRTDLLSGRSDQVRPRHPVRPEFQIQPRRAPHARNGV